MSIKEEGVGTRCNSGAPEGGSRAGGKDGGGVVCESFGDGRRGKRSGKKSPAWRVVTPQQEPERSRLKSPVAASQKPEMSPVQEVPVVASQEPVMFGRGQGAG